MYGNREPKLLHTSLLDIIGFGAGVDVTEESKLMRVVLRVMSLKKKSAKGGQAAVAEREGFEPPDRVNGQRFSRPPHSTTLPSLHGCGALITVASSGVFVNML